MKLVPTKLLLAILSFASSTALAQQSAFIDDSFIIIRDGREYICRARGNTPPDPGGAIRCAEEAYRGPFSREESQQICQGARDESPARCGIKAYSGPFNKAEAVQLCTSAWDNGPADCAIKAYAGPFNKAEAVELCARRGTIAHADCAIRAYAGPYSRAEAVRLCKAEPNLILKSLKLMESSRDLQPVLKRMQVQKAKIDASMEK